MISKQVVDGTAPPLYIYPVRKRCTPSCSRRPRLFKSIFLAASQPAYSSNGKVRNGDYLYWQLRHNGGSLRQVYLGPAHDPRARSLADALARYKRSRRPLLEDLERLTAAYVASGGTSHMRQHFKVVDALARAGVFRAGSVLIGSHAFVSIGASLGVSLDRRHVCHG